MKTTVLEWMNLPNPSLAMMTLEEVEADLARAQSKLTPLLTQCRMLEQQQLIIDIKNGLRKLSNQIVAAPVALGECGFVKPPPCFDEKLLAKQATN